MTSFSPIKRLTGLVAIFAIIGVLLAACGGGQTAQPTAAPAAPTEAPAAAATEAPTTAPAATEAPTTAPTEAPTEAAATAEPTEATAAASGELPEVDPAAVTGNIIAAGSSTVFPLAERMAENFSAEGYAGQITIDSVGTGGGFERFCNGETDIANASRAIRDEEVQACQANNIEPVEFRVGTDALVVVVSAENDFVDALTLEQLAAIYSGEAATWADVDPSYPAEPIQLFSPGTDSGTFDYFVETVFEDLEEDQREQAILGANPQLSEDDNVLVQGVEGSPFAIGYFGYAYFAGEGEGLLKALAIDGVEPNEETAESGEYPISRPLFIYSAAPIMEEKPQVAAFINYFLTNVNDEIIDVGYFPASEEALGEARNAWLSATGAAPAAGGASSGAASALPEVDPASATGNIIAAGSSTVFPLAERMAENFSAEGYAGQITIDSVGTGGGFERFCNGETDIANASRAIRDEEVQACQANNIEPVEFRVGTDALVVVVSAENDFVDALTLEQLAAIYSGEAATWADVDPSYPAEPIQLFSPGTDSGTFDYFVETVFEDLEEDQREQAILGANPQLSEDDNVLVQGVEGSPFAIGYFGYAYFAGEGEGLLKALAIDGVEPNEQTAESGEYPISRPLFIYSSQNIMQEKPQVAIFINYFLTNVNDEIIDVGYFPASEEALNAARQSWMEAAMAGS